MKEVMIEETARWNADVVGSTVVRTREKGFWVSTIPVRIIPSDGTYETIVFDFSRYERLGKTGLPILDDPGNENSDLGLNTFHSFQENPETALNYHREVVEKVAQLLEE